MSLWDQDEPKSTSLFIYHPLHIHSCLYTPASAFTHVTHLPNTSCDFSYCISYYAVYHVVLVFSSTLSFTVQIAFGPIGHNHSITISQCEIFTELIVLASEDVLYLTKIPTREPMLDLTSLSWLIHPLPTIRLLKYHRKEHVVEHPTLFILRTANVIQRWAAFLHLNLLLTTLGLSVERLEWYQFPEGAGLLCSSIRRLWSFGRCPVDPDAWRLCFL